MSDLREGIKSACKCGNCQGGYIMFQGKRSRKCYQCYKGYRLDVEAILSLFKSQIKEMEKPYSEDIFPTTIKEAGKFLKDKGLTDLEITAISGCIARLGWTNCQQDILSKLEE